jgi:hypothetical protein
MTDRQKIRILNDKLRNAQTIIRAMILQFGTGDSTKEIRIDDYNILLTGTWTMTQYRDEKAMQEVFFLRPQ